MPESHTPLAFTPVLATLSPEQRLTYNRLHALFFHEQIVFFEQLLAVPALEKLARDRRLSPELRDGVAAFLREEIEHSAMFSDLLRKADPAGYAAGNFRFTGVPAALRRLVRAFSDCPLFSPTVILIVLMQEERSLHLGAAMLKERESLDPAFVAVHRIHLADEIGHVRRDDELLETIFAPLSGTVRRIQLAILALLSERFFIVPRRGSVRVVDELVRRHPELLPRRRELVSAITSLGGDRRWRLASQSRAVTPKTFAWFDRCPPVAALATTFPGYRRPPS